MKNINETIITLSCGTTVRHIALTETASTNTYAKNMARSCHSPILVTAEKQSGGRGRQGKSFSSPKGGLYMSLLLPTGTPAAELCGVTQCAAVAVCRAAEKLCGLHCGIKWVNDIYIESRKLCGILTESVNSLKDGVLYSEAVVIGIGMNVLCRPDISAMQSSVPPCALSDYVQVTEDDIMPMCTEIVSELVSMYRRGFAYSEIRDEYEARSVLLGREIVFERGGEKLCGLCDRFGENGELSVMCGDERLLLTGGEVNIRIAR